MLINNILKEKFVKIKFGSAIAVVVLFAGTGLVSAEEIVISGNGSSSSNTITNSSSNSTNLSQSNSQDVNNNLDLEANTGANNSSGNTNGDSVIETGNISTRTEIENTGNLNYSESGCCVSNTAGNINIAENGSNSDSNITINNINNTSITSNNFAKITNNIIGNANTGNNTANNNAQGNIYIKTGNISVSENIINSPLNYNNASTFIQNTAKSGFGLKIYNNGSFTRSSITLDINEEHNVNVINALDILNESVWLLNTGRNDANYNTDSHIGILTGNIDFVSKIINGPLNMNDTTIDCCEKVKEPTSGEPPIVPPPAAKVESKPGETKPSNSTSNGEVLAAAVGNILPATGNYTLLFFLIGNVAMFLLGMVLRLRSGRSPGLVNVVA